MGAELATFMTTPGGETAPLKVYLAEQPTPDGGKVSLHPEVMDPRPNWSRPPVRVSRQSPSMSPIPAVPAAASAAASSAPRSPKGPSMASTALIGLAIAAALGAAVLFPACLQLRQSQRLLLRVRRRC